VVWSWISVLTRRPRSSRPGIHKIADYAQVEISWRLCSLLRQHWDGFRSTGRLAVEDKYQTCDPTLQFAASSPLPICSRPLSLKASHVRGLGQRFPNCGRRTTSGTRRPSTWYTNMLTTFCLSSQKFIYSYVFYLSGSVDKFLNFCVLPVLVFKMVIIISHSHYLHVAFVSILVFQTFDRMIFGKLSFPGTRWYEVTVLVPQMIRVEKTFGNYWLRRTGGVFVA